MKKLIVFAVLLFGPAMTQQAAACDMGAIETWVASACNGNTCGTNRPTSSWLEVAMAAIAPSFSPQR